jgi:hypothetical protein
MQVKLTGPFTPEDLREIAALLRKFDDRDQGRQHYFLEVIDLTKTAAEAVEDLKRLFPYSYNPVTCEREPIDLVVLKKS